MVSHRGIYKDKNAQSNVDEPANELYYMRLQTLWSELKRQHKPFWWLCVYFLFEYIRPQSLYPAIDIIPWGLTCLMLVLVFSILDRETKWVPSSANKTIIIFSVVVALSIMVAHSPIAALNKIDIYLSWLILYFAFIAIVNNENKLILFIVFFLLINFKMSQFGARNFLLHGYSSYGVSGSPGWFKDAGDLGHQMIVFVCFSIAFIVALKKYWSRTKFVLFSLAPITGMLTIIATASRGVQLGIACTALWFILKSKGGLKVLLLISAAGVVFYNLLPPEMISEFRNAGEDSTSQQRLILWDIGWETLKEHPFLGVGYYNWLEYCSSQYPFGIPGTRRDHCLVIHNTYISAGTELGFIGLSLYLLLVLTVFRLNYRTRKLARDKNDFLYFMAHGSDGGLVGFLVASTFFDMLFYPIFWVQLGISVAINNIAGKLAHD